jgi:Tol biopolymer transport system component
VLYFTWGMGGATSLYRLPTQGGGPVELAGDLVNEVFENVSATPDSQHLIIMTKGLPGQGPGLYSVPIAGGAPVRLNGHGPSRPIFIRHLPDSQHLLFGTDQERPGTTELYSVPVTGGARTKLTAPFAEGAELVWFMVSHDGQRVVYGSSRNAREGEPSIDALFLVPVGGGTAEQVLGQDGPADVISFAFSPDDRSLLFYTDWDDDLQMELCSLPLPGWASPVESLVHWYLPVVWR